MSCVLVSISKVNRNTMRPLPYTVISSSQAPYERLCQETESRRPTPQAESLREKAAFFPGSAGSRCRVAFSPQMQVPPRAPKKGSKSFDFEPFCMCLLARASSGPLFPAAAIGREGQRRACQQQDPEEMVQSRAGTAGLRELCSGLIYDCD